MELDFQNIVDQVQNILPSKWRKAVFMAEYTLGSYSMRCFADCGDGEYKDCTSFDGLPKGTVIKTYQAINREIKKHRDVLTEDKLWYALTLFVDEEGRFKAEFDYHPHEENALNYIEEWKKKYLL